MTQLLVIALILLIVYLWWDARRSYQVAMRVCRAACARAEVQLLDETVALRRLRLCRGAGGQMQLCREYRFEFTQTGAARYPGWLRMRGQRLEELTLDLHNDGAPESATLH
jgi:hypothetical protein